MNTQGLKDIGSIWVFLAWVFFLAGIVSGFYFYGDDSFIKAIHYFITGVICFMAFLSIGRIMQFIAKAYEKRFGVDEDDQIENSET